mmetsp:Transcript_23998/g.38604  ORF Transcript_23998/g.38604 Transcript_23998/m.38604 type:complete len:217 (+) Transcript_23998:14-664(+)
MVRIQVLLTRLLGCCRCALLLVWRQHASLQLICRQSSRQLLRQEMLLVTPEIQQTPNKTTRVMCRGMAVSMWFCKRSCGLWERRSYGRCELSLSWPSAASRWVLGQQPPLIKRLQSTQQQQRTRCDMLLALHAGLFRPAVLTIYAHDIWVLTIYGLAKRLRASVVLGKRLRAPELIVCAAFIVCRRCLSWCGVLRIMTWLPLMGMMQMFACCCAMQ